MTLSEYASEVAAAVEKLDSRLDAHAEELFSGPVSVDDARAYVDARVAGYRDLVASIDAIDPPEEVAELHAAFLDIMGRLLVAEEARAAFAATVTSAEGIDAIWEGPEAQAVNSVEQEAIVLCHAAQEHMDETEAREALAGVPWIPDEMKEVVRVAFSCPE